MVAIRLPRLHSAQQQVRREAERFNVLACGRRWGKSCFGEVLVCETGLAGDPAGWFAPTYKLLDPIWHDMVQRFRPLGGMVEMRKQERTIRLATGGSIDFWTLDNPDAGRGRKYRRIVIDEAAMVRELEAAWTMSIRPTLIDLQGDAWFASTPKGMGYFHRLWTLGQDGAEPGWRSWRMPTDANPYMPAEELAAMRASMPADAVAQEIDAEFLADAANPFGVTAIRACLQDEPTLGPPVAWGVDLAKSQDWTVAIALDAQGRLCGIQRWQSDWRNTRARVAAMIAGNPALVDSTGVGNPIVEDLQTRCPLAEGFIFTNASKQQLMEGLALALQTGEVGIVPGVLQHELESFGYEYLPGGRVRYAAPPGMHDDCVCALALAAECHRRVGRNQVSMRIAGSNEEYESGPWDPNVPAPWAEERMWTEIT